MPRLRATTSVSIAPHRLRAELERVLSALQGKDGVARLRLRVSSDGAVRNSAFDRAVRVEMLCVQDPKANEALEISWLPEGTTILPTFKGTVAVWGDEDRDISYVELDGDYTPPSGAGGQNFDGLIGNRIAHATAQTFLRDFRQAMESEP